MSTPFSSIKVPLVAILRGLTSSDAAHVGKVLFEAGFRLLEVPLNRPGAIDAIRILHDMMPPDAMVGGGTVMTLQDVDAIEDAKGRLIISPHCDPEVIAYSVKRGLVSMPGVATATEAFRALAAGAHGLKLFPADMVTPAAVKSLRSVIPAGVPLFPVGGIHAGNMAPYYAAGASGFGIGSQLYQPGVDLQALRTTADEFMAVRQKLLAQ
ncbi:MAG: 2-dehydro-3-deoxy-6-phosphogalactonate aldolase [Pseudomonadota bacterium]